MTRVLYVQYTNPAGYPPLEYSATILASRGAEIRVLGTDSEGTDKLSWVPHRLISIATMRVRSTGLKQKLDYARYTLLVIRSVIRFRPHWLYVSDALAAPIALVVRAIARVRVVYHEHDEPAAAVPTAFMRLVLGARRYLVRTADEVVVPNAARAGRLEATTGRTLAVRVVWNCPLTGDAAESPPPSDGHLRVIYQGSIVRSRLPITVIEAIARTDDVELTIVGYETVGSRDYVKELLHEAERRGVCDRVHFLGSIARHELLEITSKCHVGLSLMPMDTTDFNQRHMAGASNKAFEYMARGLGLVVSDLPEWRSMFAEQGFAFTCDPRDPRSIASALHAYAADRARTRQLGQAAQERIRTEWNYESQFASLADVILNAAGRSMVAQGPNHGV